MGTIFAKISYLNIFAWDGWSLSTLKYLRTLSRKVQKQLENSLKLLRDTYSPDIHSFDLVFLKIGEKLFDHSFDNFFGHIFAIVQHQTKFIFCAFQYFVVIILIGKFGKFAFVCVIHCAL